MERKEPKIFPNCCMEDVILSILVRFLFLGSVLLLKQNFIWKSCKWELLCKVVGRTIWNCVMVIIYIYIYYFERLSDRERA